MKQTPKDVLGHMIQSGSFQAQEQKRLLKDINGCTVRLAPIDAYKFGEYFLKCTGTLNSILKEGTSKEGSKYAQVVKKSIGFKYVDWNGQPNGNSRYVNTKNVYSVLHPNHIPLVCKKAKREAVQDFWNLKEDFIVRFHAIKGNLSQFVHDQVIISDVFDIGEKNPSGNQYSYHDIGHMVMNTRIVEGSAIAFSVSDDSNSFSSYEDRMGSWQNAYARPSETGDIEVCCILETDVVDANGNIRKDRINLFRMRIKGTKNVNYATKPNFHLYNHKFDGINVEGIHNYVMNEYNAFHGEFETRLDALRDKYLAEYMLNEICDDDSDTAI